MAVHSPFNRFRPHAILRHLALGFLLAAAVVTGPAHSQGPASNQCGEYVEAYKAGRSAYEPYLSAAAEVARSRDAQQGQNRYAAALNASAPAANALWLHNWCLQNPLKRIAEASSHLLDELTGQAAPAAAAVEPPPRIMVVPAQPLFPTSCRVGDTKFCPGCAISCNGPAKAQCKQGTDFLLENGPCAFQSKCECK